MGWITVFLASGPARKALGLLLTTLTIGLFLLNLRRAGERAGRLAERLSTSRENRCHPPPDAGRRQPPPR
jgi:hypothetical protein